MTTATPMDPKTRAELEERVKIGRAAEKALGKAERELSEGLMAEIPQGRLNSFQFEVLRIAVAHARLALAESGPQFQEMDCLGAVAEVCARYAMRMPRPWEVPKPGPKMGAGDCVEYLIKEAALDHCDLRHYVRDYKGAKFKVTIEREGK